MSTLKGGEFLIKEIEAKNIFTMEDFSEEQKMLRDSAREFIDKVVVPNKERFEKKDYAFTEECMKQIGEMGFLGIAVPENYGGLGLGFVSTMIACDYISGATGSLATAYGAHTGIGTLPILLYGTEAQKQKYLPDLAAGTKFGAYCLTEPDAGSDANSGKTRAKLSEDGKHYIINGQKMWISNAGFADTFTFFAKIDDDKNITGFVVNRSELENPESLTFGEEEHKLGIRASSTRQVFFNDMKVPVECLLGERNNGFKIALNALNVGRIKLAAACFKPFLSRVPVTTITITNTHILRLATKLDPSVSKKVTGSIPATSAVTIAAIIIIKIESNFNTNPITTIRMPNNFNNSIIFHSLFHISYRNLYLKLYHILQQKQKKWIKRSIYNTSL